MKVGPEGGSCRGDSTCLFFLLLSHGVLLQCEWSPIQSPVPSSVLGVSQTSAITELCGEALLLGRRVNTVQEASFQAVPGSLSNMSENKYISTSWRLNLLVKDPLATSSHTTSATPHLLKKFVFLLFTKLWPDFLENKEGSSSPFLPISMHRSHSPCWMVPRSQVSPLGGYSFSLPHPQNCFPFKEIVNSASMWCVGKAGIPGSH